MTPADTTGPATWMGECPKTWMPRRLKHVLARNDGGVWGEDGDEEDTLVLRSTELDLDGSWTIADPAYRRLSSAERLKALVRAGDLVVTKSSGSQDHLGKTGVVTPELEERRCAYSNFMQRLRVSIEADAKYVFWLINSRICREALNYFGSTTTGLRNLTGTILGDLPFPGPPLSEQRGIADFLDRKTAAIDALAGRRQQQLQTLLALKAATIDHAVIQGLSEGVATKDSGLPWLGRCIPSHWTVKRLKHISPRVSVGVVVNPSHYCAAEGAPFLLGKNVYAGGLRLEDVNRIDPESNRILSTSMLRAGDLVSVRVGAPGVTAVIPPELDGCNCASVMIIRQAPDVASQWLCYAMNSLVGRMQVGAVQYGAAQEAFNVGHAVDFSFPVPPLAEQRAIADYLDKTTLEFDGVSRALASQLALLREYRQALITAAVSGQLAMAKDAA